MCKASIVIPAYNASPFIRVTLNSILAQTYTDFECIVIDDGSTDDTVDVVRSYNDSRIKIIQQKNSGGPAKPRNVGLMCAKGEYIFLFDADDVMLPTKLHASICAFEAHPDADFLFSDFSSINEKDEILRSDYLQEYNTLWDLLSEKPADGAVIPIDSQKIYPALIKINFIGTSSVALRRSALPAGFVFNESLKNSDDRLFWIQFTKNHHAVFINSMLHQYRIQPNSITNQNFVYRGKYKIQALQLAKENCDDAQLKKILNKQISTNYFSLAYAYKLKNDTKNERLYAFKSIQSSININAIKLFLHGFYQSILTGR